MSCVKHCPRPGNRALIWDNQGLIAHQIYGGASPPFKSSSRTLRTASGGAAEVRERVSKNTLTHSAAARQASSRSISGSKRAVADAHISGKTGFLEIIDRDVGEHGIEPVRHGRQIRGDERHPGDLDPDAIGGIVDVAHAVFIGIAKADRVPVAIGPGVGQDQARWRRSIVAPCFAQMARARHLL